MANVVLQGQPFAVNTVFGVGRNYVAHIAELGNEVPSEPLVFLKPNSSVLNGDGEICLPKFSSCVHYETELVLLIGADSDGVCGDAAWDLVAGIGVGLDLTARDVQAEAKAQGLPWSKAKGFKHAACVSPFVAVQAADREAVRFGMSLNGQPVQSGDTRHMIYPVAELLGYLAETYGLRRGDLVFTGTPSGVGELRSGDCAVLDLDGRTGARFQVK